MLRPLLVSSSLNLVFEDCQEMPPVYSDEGKVSQILRNFIANALKFTEAGEVRVSVRFDAAADTVLFRVRDTGIGILEEHRETIFQEFSQVDSPLQRVTKGTGLGLPISKKLAEVLGGGVGVISEPGKGSEFWLRIPRSAAQEEPAPQPADTRSPERPVVLIVEDHAETRMAYEKYLRLSPWRAVAARTVREAEGVLRHTRPCAIVLDVELQGEQTWNFLVQIKSNTTLCDIPVIVAPTVPDPSKAMALGADLYLAKPVSGPALRGALRKVTGAELRNVLLVDDQDVSRYLSRQLFDGARVNFFEAEDGVEALDIARAEKPDLMVIDLVMPHMSGFELLSGIEAEPDLRKTPVIVVTSKLLSSEERGWLRLRSLAVLSKDRLLESEAARTLASALTTVGLESLIDSSRAPLKRDNPTIEASQ